MNVCVLFTVAVAGAALAAPSASHKRELDDNVQTLPLEQLMYASYMSQKEPMKEPRAGWLHKAHAWLCSRHPQHRWCQHSGQQEKDTVSEPGLVLAQLGPVVLSGDGADEEQLQAPLEPSESRSDDPQAWIRAGLDPRIHEAGLDLLCPGETECTPSLVDPDCSPSSGTVESQWGRLRGGACVRGGVHGLWMRKPADDDKSAFSISDCVAPGVLSCEARKPMFSASNLLLTPPADVVPSGFLVLFLGGTGSAPVFYHALLEAASRAGHHALTSAASEMDERYERPTTW